MEYTLKEISQAIGESEIIGDPNYKVSSPAPLKEAGAKQISFYANSKFKDFIGSCQAGALLVDKNKAAEAAGFPGGKILAANVIWAWAKTLKLWENGAQSEFKGLNPKASIAPNAQLGKNVSVGAFAVIEDGARVGEETTIYPNCFIGKNVSVGSNAIIYPNVVIRENCAIGDRVIIHSGAVIGSDGYGFVTVNGKHEKIPQIGNVVIENDVEVGANVTIDRATVGTTRIGEGTKIDNLVQIAHNVDVGKHCLLVAQSGIAGSSKLGNYVVLGGQSGVSDHVEIAEGTMVGGGAGVIGDVKTKEILWGMPARKYKEQMRLLALMNKLPEIYETVKSLTKKKVLETENTQKTS